VLAQPGTYARNTTYTILSANGGVSGTYTGVSSNFAFLTPSLSYSANDAQNGGTYVVEANAQSQSDRINATGTATINGGAVQVLAAGGSYGNRRPTQSSMPPAACQAPTPASAATSPS
jgi:hypothetical protein